MKEKAIIWLDRIMEFSLCAFVFTLPFSKSMVEIFFGCALASWITKRYIKYYTLSAIRYPLKDKISELMKAFKPVRTELNLPIAGFIFVGFLSAITSISLPLSLEGFFLKLFEWIMIYFIVVETISSKERLNRILAVMFFSITLIAIDGIFQFITGADFIRNYPIAGYRICASFGNPNSFAGWLVVMVPFALSLSFFGINRHFNLLDKWVKKNIRPMLWVITGLLIVCLALTYTKGAWIAFVLLLILFGILKSKKILIIIVIALLILPFVLPDSIKNRVSSIMKIPETNVYRLALWQEALGIIEDFPLLGCGLNTYATVGSKYKITEVTGFYPHNSYLHMAAESGLLGLGAFIWIMITLFRTSLADLKRIQSRFYSALLLGLLVGLFGFLAHSFVDTNIYTLQLGNLMWFVMGLIIATQKIALEHRNEATLGEKSSDQ